MSNLTNLIAVEQVGAGTVGFLTHLALPSVVASGAGWWCYRRRFDPDRSASVFVEPAEPIAVEGRSARLAAVVLTSVVVGFVLGPTVGIPAWSVALVADIVIFVMLRRRPRLADVPFGTAAAVAAIGVLAAGAAAAVDVGRVLGGSGSLGLARTMGVAALGANLLNNLPTLLVALPAVAHHTGPQTWAVLLGVNMGPVVLVTGSLASMLWLDTVNRLGVRTTTRDFTRIGLSVGLPAAAAGAMVFLLATRLM